MMSEKDVCIHCIKMVIMRSVGTDLMIKYMKVCINVHTNITIHCTFPSP